MRKTHASFRRMRQLFRLLTVDYGSTRTGIGNDRIHKVNSACEPLGRSTSGDSWAFPFLADVEMCLEQPNGSTWINEPRRPVDTTARAGLSRFGRDPRHTLMVCLGVCARSGTRI